MLHRLKSSNHFMAFFVQMCATALGLLIALGIDQWKTNRATRSLVLQSRGFIAREIQTNRTELTKAIASMEGSYQGLVALHSFLLALEKAPVPATSPLRQKLRAGKFNWEFPTLLASSWDAAVASQSVSHMQGWRVEKVARAFAAQKTFLELQTLTLTKIGVLNQASPLVEEADSSGLPPKEAKALRLQIDEFLILFQACLASGKELEKSCDEAINACQAP